MLLLSLHVLYEVRRLVVLIRVMYESCLAGRVSMLLIANVLQCGRIHDGDTRLLLLLLWHAARKRRRGACRGSELESSRASGPLHLAATHTLTQTSNSHAPPLESRDSPPT